ncbi:uncharacterized protein LOC118636089 [Molossus molossus]|uniref:uncharacterized protein LOC118636089 n=1 Tax=Molossus molossus TaxID=27622 RepID=UPI001747AF86|nr:uncharacterized protein LOC118636089 [Molossus molossus]
MDKLQDYLITWTQILFISCCFLTVHCAQPNCTSVTDFDDCPGNIRDFCPENIVCACKDGEPFCKCPYFRGRWGNYWYMGTKCDQIWNTLDLILVATLPGIGLALIVGVMIQTVHYCKKKSKKNINDHREERSSSELQPQHNSAYVFDTAVRLSQPDQVQNPRTLSLQNVRPTSPSSPPPQFAERNYNCMLHKPREDNHHIYPSYNWNGSLEPAKHEANYGNKYSSTTHMKPLFNFSTHGAPPSNYIQRERQQLGYTSSEEQEIPYRIERVQLRPNY